MLHVIAEAGSAILDASNEGRIRLMHVRSAQLIKSGGGKSDIGLHDIVAVMLFVEPGLLRGRDVGDQRVKSSFKKGGVGNLEEGKYLCLFLQANKNVSLDIVLVDFDVFGTQE